MWEFPDDLLHIPLARWVDKAVAWLTIEGAGLFGVIGDVLRSLLLRVEAFFLWLPWVLVVGGTMYLAWRALDAKMAVGAGAGLVFIGALGLWNEAMATLALIISATLVATVFGVPAGILMARSRGVAAVLRPLLDLMQTMPNFVYLIPTLMLFGLGKVPALIATVVYGVPPVIRLTNLGIREVAADVVEAAQSFGSSPWQVLLWVQVPLALPTIMAGVNQTDMMAVAMVVIASMIGTGGLGAEVLRGIARLEVGHGFAGGVSIVILAIIIDRLSQSPAHKRRATPLP